MLVTAVTKQSPKAPLLNNVCDDPPHAQDIEAASEEMKRQQANTQQQTTIQDDDSLSDEGEDVVQHASCCQLTPWPIDAREPKPSSDEDADARCSRTCFFYNLLVGMGLLVIAVLLIVVINVSHGAPVTMHYPNISWQPVSLPPITNNQPQAPVA